MTTVFTIGHSTRALDEFLEILRAHRIEEIVDVRRFPGSKRYPHFGGESLQRSLSAVGIGYRHEPDMGGRRTPRPDSAHTAWRSPSFRAYADHMESAVFQERLQELIDNAALRRQAVMCAEAVPWRCHRQLISDALVARGVDVCHILNEKRTDPHALSSHATITSSGGVAYSPPAEPQTDLGLEQH